MSSGYFDYNATTPLSDGVQQAVQEAMQIFANPSARYQKSQQAKQLIQSARFGMGNLLGCAADEILFTSGGTESNNLAIRSVLDRFPSNYLAQQHVITTAMEHPSVLELLRWYQAEYGLQVSYIKPDYEGRVSVEAINAAITAQTCLISLMAINNETGTIQPFEAVAELARQRGIHCHIDAVQAVGKIPLNCHELGVHTLSFSGHKFHSPKGIGGLFCHSGCTLAPLFHGGGQEGGLRSGTENTLGLSGLATAANECYEHLEQQSRHYEKLRRLALDSLRQHQVAFSCNGATSVIHQAPWTLNISLKGIRAEALAARLDLCHNIAVSLGSACNNNKTQRRSHVLTAMGLCEQQIDSAIRISFGRFTLPEDIDHLAAAIASEVQVLLQMAPARQQEQESVYES